MRKSFPMPVLEDHSFKSIINQNSQFESSLWSEQISDRQVVISKNIIVAKQVQLIKILHAAEVIKN